MAMKKKLGLLLILVTGLSGGIWGKLRYDRAHRYEAKGLSFPDLADGDFFARVNSVGGAESSRQMAYPGSTEPGGPLKEGTQLKLGVELITQKGASAWFGQPSGVFFNVEGDASVGVLDARTNADRTKHQIVFSIKKGILRVKTPPAKSHDPVHWVEIRLPGALIRMTDGEIGMNLDEKGHGLVWLMGGEGEMITADGARQPLVLKQLAKV